VQTPEDFAAWVKNQQQPSVQDPAVAEGRQLFASQACISCHVVRGTAAQGRFGPDLTHFMSRDTLASGSVTNTPENLRAWIRNPEAFKPGSRMPVTELTDKELDQIVAYLLTLR